MTIATWLVLALIAGAIAKLVTPGRDFISWTGTPVIGIAGLLVGSKLASFLQIDAMHSLDVATLVAATVGAMVVYAGYRVLFDVPPARRSFSGYY